MTQESVVATTGQQSRSPKDSRDIAPKTHWRRRCKHPARVWSRQMRPQTLSHNLHYKIRGEQRQSDLKNRLYGTPSDASTIILLCRGKRSREEDSTPRVAGRPISHRAPHQALPSQTGVPRWLGRHWQGYDDLCATWAWQNPKDLGRMSNKKFATANKHLNPPGERETFVFGCQARTGSEWPSKCFLQVNFRRHDARTLMRRMSPMPACSGVSTGRSQALTAFPLALSHLYFSPGLPGLQLHFVRPAWLHTEAKAEP